MRESGRAHYFKIGRVKIDVTSYQKTIDLIKDVILRKDKGYICVSNMRTVAIANRDDAYLEVMENSLMNTPDGAPLIWCARLWGIKDAQRVCGPDLFEKALIEDPTGIKHYFLGETVETLNRLNARLSESDTVISGTYSPPFKPLEEYDLQGIANRINESGANVVWTSLKAPKQDFLNAKLLPLLNNGIVLIGVGAAFRVFLREYKTPKGFLAKMGLGGFTIIRNDSNIWKELIWYSKHSVLLAQYMVCIFFRRLIGKKAYE